MSGPAGSGPSTCLAIGPRPLQDELRPPSQPRGKSIRHLALQTLDFQVLLLQVPLLLGHLVEELLNPAVLGLELSLGERAHSTAVRTRPSAASLSIHRHSSGLPALPPERPGQGSPGSPGCVPLPPTLSETRRRAEGAHVPAGCRGSRGRPRHWGPHSRAREGARRTPRTPCRPPRTRADAAPARPAAPGCAPRARAARGPAAGARAPARSPRPRTRSAAAREARRAPRGPARSAARRCRRTAPRLPRPSAHSASFRAAWARERKAEARAGESRAGDAGVLAETHWRSEAARKAPITAASLWGLASPRDAPFL